MPSMTTGVETGGGFDPGRRDAGPVVTTPGGVGDDGYYDPALDDEEPPFFVDDFGDGGQVATDARDYEDEPGEGAQSPMRAILSSLGGMIWIVLFVLFSLARSCGE